MSNSKDIVILGAGVCGLYAALTALRRGAGVTVIEKNDFPGGLAAGFKRGANFFDQGVHMLHATDPEIYEDVAELMGRERLPVSLDARICWNNRSYRYPLKGLDLLAGMNPFQLGRCVLGLIIADIQNRLNQTQATAVSAEDALIATYGDPLYEFFFKDFTHRYWNIPPSQLSAEFVRRKMPRLNVLDLVKKWLPKFPGKKSADLVVASATTDETLHYSETGAETLPRVLANEIEKLGGNIIYDCDIQEITTNEIRLSNSSLSFQNLLSTIPLPSLIHLISTAPFPIRRAAKELKFKPIVTYGLLVRKAKCLEGLYTYYRNRIFHRVGEPANAGLKVSPSGHSVLIVELTCEQGDQKWNDTPAIRQSVVSDLIAEGICMPENIIEWHHFTNPNGYPIYRLNFEQHLTKVQQWLGEQKQITSTGRQGAFTFPGMHNAMRMGQVAVDSILSKA